MKRRELLSAAVLAAAAARAQDAGVAVAAAPGKWPGEEKLGKAKRDISRAMAKVRLANEDAPDLLPRAQRRSK